MAASITYGASLAALQFAIENKTKIIINRLNFPLEFEKKYIKEAWALLYTKLMLSGQTIGGDTVQKTQVSDDYISVVCKGNVVNKVKYHTLFIFCDKNISGLPPVEKENRKYDVVDYMKPQSLISKVGFHMIKTEERFVSHLYVLKKYSTAPIKIYALSELTDKQLYEFNFSDTMAKFKSEHLLQERGFEGNIMRHKRTPIVLEVIGRDTTKQMDFYEDTDKIKFLYGHHANKQRKI